MAESIDMLAIVLAGLDRGENLGQAVIRLLLEHGYIEATRVNHLGSEEYWPTSITPSGRELLKHAIRQD